MSDALAQRDGMQRLFEMAVKGLAAQDWQPARNTEYGSMFTCRYRHNGRKCAIGQLIKDELYDKKIEGATVEDPLVHDLVSRSTGVLIADNYMKEFLTQLQRCHDAYSTSFGMQRALLQLASTFGLFVPDDLFYLPSTTTEEGQGER